MIRLPSTPHQKTVTVFISKRVMMQEEAILQLRPSQTHSHSVQFAGSSYLYYLRPTALLLLVLARERQ